MPIKPYLCLHSLMTKDGTQCAAVVLCFHIVRRDVWHGTDMAGAGRLRAQWNEALLQLVVAPAYLELLTAAAALLGPGPHFNRYNSCNKGCRTKSLFSCA